MNKLKLKEYRKIVSYTLLFILILFFSYRDFLITYRMMLLDNDFVYYHYQNIIIYYETGNSLYADDLPMSSRFLGLILQYLIFKIVPCFELTNINLSSKVNDNFVCATFSLAFLNFVFKYAIIILFSFYMKHILNRNIYELIISIILCFIFINYIEAFTFDRLTVFFTLLILASLKTRYLSHILILSSFLVSEKIIMIIGPLIFLKIYLLKQKNYLPIFISSITTVILYIFMIYILKSYFGFEFSNLYNNAGFHRLILDITDKSHLSNSILPIFFCIIPYLIYLNNKNKYNLEFSGYEFLIPFLMVLLGTGGGENNLGRYAMHTFILWLPIFSCQLAHFLKLDEK